MNGVQWGRALYRISKRLSLATALVNHRCAYLSPRSAPVEAAMEAAYCVGAQIDRMLVAKIVVGAVAIYYLAEGVFPIIMRNYWR